MSWLFDAAGEKLEIVSSVITDQADPWTISAWIKASDIAPASNMFAVTFHNNSTDNLYALLLTITTATPQLRIRDTTNATATASAALAGTGTWYHIAARSTGANSYAVYLDGANVGTSGSTKSISGFTRITLGNEPGGNRFKGRMAHVAIWGSDIGAADIADLAAGRNPLDTGYFPAPTAYWTLDNASTGLDDVSGSAFGSLTETGATFDADNPTVDSTTTNFLKLLADASAASAASIEGVVLNAARDTVIGEFSGQAFEASLEGGEAVLLIDVADITPDGSTLTTSDTPIVFAYNATESIIGPGSATVVEI